MILSHSQSLSHRLYDMSRRSFVEFAGSEAVPAVATFGLHDQGEQISRLVDLVAVLNHNAAGLVIERSENNGGSYSTAHTTAALTDSDTLIALAAPVAANKMRITAAATQSAGLAKRIGSIVVAEVLLQPAVHLSVFEPIMVAGQIIDRMGDKSLRTAYNFHADDDFILKDYSVGFDALTRAQLRELEDAVLHHKEPLVFIPFPGDLPDEVALVELDAVTWRYKPTNNTYLGSGWNLDFILRSVGGR